MSFASIAVVLSFCLISLVDLTSGNHMCSVVGSEHYVKAIEIKLLMALLITAAFMSHVIKLNSIQTHTLRMYRVGQKSDTPLAFEFPLFTHVSISLNDVLRLPM